MKLFNWFLATVFLLSIFLLNACYRQDSLSTTVTFEGTVYRGVPNSSGGITVLGPVVGGRVYCEKYEGSAITDNSGRYTLKVSPAPRRFEGPDYDTYVLWATDGVGGDEKITVKAKNGQTIQVRPFLIYQHNYE